MAEILMCIRLQSYQTYVGVAAIRPEELESCFRQYDIFNQYVFLKYLKELQRKFRKLLLFIDGAVQQSESY